MASFKTRKLPHARGKKYPHTQKDIHSTSPVPPSLTPKKRARRLAGIMLMGIGFIFFTYLGLQAIGNINIGGNRNEADMFRGLTINPSGQPEQKGVRNILIAGIGGRWHPGGELTDSLMLVNMNFDTKSVTMLSIPRDMYVAYGPRSAGKINALYPIGQNSGEWVNLLVKKVSEITNQPIHHYAVIDFSGFKQIVDALDGVEVDVPKAIYDNAYPNNNWGYEIFSLPAGVQYLDGATALKFARSRHSTSDFDRSHRQQLLIRAIKDKALSLGIIANPVKITELMDSVRNNLSTDLTVGDIVNFGLAFKDIDNSQISMHNLHHNCGTNQCVWGGLLYHPSSAYTGNAWAIIPEWATMSRLSTYDSIRRYVDLLFRFPSLTNQTKSISIITSSTNLQKARLIRRNLMQLGFPIESNRVIVQTGGITWPSRINAYWNETAGIGFNEKHILIEALRHIENTIPVSYRGSNEFVRDDGPRIEIILGDDASEYFSFAKSVTYLPEKASPVQSSTSSTDESHTQIESEITHEWRGTEESKPENRTENSTSPVDTIPESIFPPPEIVSDLSGNSEELP